MSLVIAIGLSGPKPTDPVFPIYVGRSAAEARVAIDRSTAPRTLLIRNPIGVNKRNALAEQNAQRLAAESATMPDAVPSEMEQARERIAILEANVKLAEDAIAAANVRAAQLEEKLAAATAKPAKKKAE